MAGLRPPSGDMDTEKQYLREADKARALSCYRGRSSKFITRPRTDSFRRQIEAT